MKVRWPKVSQILENEQIKISLQNQVNGYQIQVKKKDPDQ